MYKASGAKVYILENGNEIELHPISCYGIGLDGIKNYTINKILADLKEDIPIWAVMRVEEGLRSDNAWNDKDIVSMDYNIQYDKEDNEITGVNITLIKKYKED